MRLSYCRSRICLKINECFPLTAGRDAEQVNVGLCAITSRQTGVATIDSCRCRNQAGVCAWKPIKGEPRLQRDVKTPTSKIGFSRIKT